MNNQVAAFTACFYERFILIAGVNPSLCSHGARLDQVYTIKLCCEGFKSLVNFMGF